MCKASKREPTDRQLEHAIKRNFGGYNKFDPYEVFQKYLGVKTLTAKSHVKSVSILIKYCRVTAMDFINRVKMICSIQTAVLSLLWD